MIDLQIRQQLAQYLANEISLKDFQDWFVPNTWELEKRTNNQGALDVRNTIDLALAELTNGHLSEDELQRRLLPLVQTYVVQINFSGFSASASFPEDFVKVQASQSALAYDITREVEYV